MFNKSIKTVLAAGILAVGTAASTTAPAQAGGNFSLYIGNGYGPGIHFGTPHRYGKRYYKKNHRRAGCFPRRALNKAYRYGLNRPYIKRINRNRIVVEGWNRGYQAKIVFKRNSRGCRILKTRGI